MRAAIVREFGPIASHEIGQFPDPTPGPGEVLVDVHATAVNFVDSLVVTGKYQFLPPRPFVPGKLPAGIVSAVGAGVTDLKIGDRVLTLAEQGGYAEQVAVSAAQCFRLPASMSFSDAASMALAYDTAWFAIHARARLLPSESVLVLGSTGGVGIAAVQLAKAIGARVLAGVYSAGKKNIPLDAGADEIIDLSAKNLRENLREQVYAKNNGNGVDVVIDPIGGDAFDASIRALNWEGRLVVIGFASGRIPSVAVNYLLVKNIEVSGLQVSDYRKRKPALMKECFRQMFELFEAGKIKPPPTVTYPLEEFAKGLQEVVDRRASGRIVLDPRCESR